MGKICCVFNYPSHYRYSIYKCIEENLDVDYYFGDKLDTKIKSFDVKSLKSFKGFLQNKFCYRGVYQKGLISLYLSKKYNRFLITGESRNLSLWIILLLNIFIKKDIALWTHGWYGKEKGFSKILKKIFYKLPNHIFLYGDYAKKLMLLEGFPSEKLTPIYNSLEYFNQVKLRKTLSPTRVYKDHFKNNYPTLCFIGRIQTIKKIEQIIDSLRLLESKRQCRCNLVIIGEGGHMDMLKKCVIQNKLENRVWFYGASYNEEINGELLFNAELCVSPGNVGLTSIHAMTYGCPVITHNSFGFQMPEFEVIIPGVTGLFFEKDSIVDLTNKIYEWLTLATERSQIRQDCYKIVDEKYNPHYQVRVLKNYYENTSN